MISGTNILELAVILQSFVSSSWSNGISNGNFEINNWLLKKKRWSLYIKKSMCKRNTKFHENISNQSFLSHFPNIVTSSHSTLIYWSTVEGLCNIIYIFLKVSDNQTLMFSEDNWLFCLFKDKNSEEKEQMVEETIEILHKLITAKVNGSLPLPSSCLPFLWPQLQTTSLEHILLTCKPKATSPSSWLVGCPGSTGHLPQGTVAPPEPHSWILA